MVMYDVEWCDMVCCGVMQCVDTWCGIVCYDVTGRDVLYYVVVL